MTTLNQSLINNQKDNIKNKLKETNKLKIKTKIIKIVMIL